MSEPTRHVSKTGGSKDLKIERYDQIPTGPLAELAARYGVGSLKYDQVNGLDNWRNGYPWSWSYRALIGHANDFWAGKDFDEAAYLGTDNEDPFNEDGSPRPGITHLAAVAWHAFALLEWAVTHPEFDDRPSTVVERNRRSQEYLAASDALGDLGEKVQQILSTNKDSGPKSTNEDPVDPPEFSLGDVVKVTFEDSRECIGNITGIRHDRETGILYDVRYTKWYNGSNGAMFVPAAQVSRA
jgi:hypothetical protein